MDTKFSAARAKFQARDIHIRTCVILRWLHDSCAQQHWQELRKRFERLVNWHGGQKLILVFIEDHIFNTERSSPQSSLPRTNVSSRDTNMAEQYVRMSDEKAERVDEHLTARMISALSCTAH